MTGATTDNAEAMDEANEIEIETEGKDEANGIDETRDEIRTGHETIATYDAYETMMVLDEIKVDATIKSEGITEAMIKDVFTNEEEDTTKGEEGVEERAATPQQRRGVAKAKEEPDKGQGHCRVRDDSDKRTGVRAASLAEQRAEPAELAAEKATETR